MWGSRNKDRRSYQVIDDDYDDQDVRSSVTAQNSLLPINSRLRYTDEGQTLISQGTSNFDPEVGYQGPPVSHSAGDVSFHPIGIPANMAGSSRDEHRWEHIENLDEFFTRVYEYHQGGGYTCIAAKHLLSLIQFLFIVIFSTFFLQCVDYDVLFRNKNTTADGVVIPIGSKRTIGDAVVSSCPAHLHPFIVICILLAITFWIARLIKTLALLMKLQTIQDFYNNALNIDDAQLGNMTWHAIVKRICEINPRLHLIINHETLSPIDIYHRILRFKNYMIALVNKRLLPPILSVPFLGDVPYLPNLLKNNLEWLLFWGYFSPWKGPYMLKDEFKNPAKLEELTIEMERTVTILGIFHVLFFPLIFVYQVLYSFFTLAELIKREPGALGMRRYSNYGRYKVRHFNELEHELRARLNRSHGYATAYVNQFYSPLVAQLAKHVAFMASAIFGVLAVLSAWDEDVLQVEHILTTLTVSGVVVIVCKSLIPDENLVWQPEVLMEHVASELHYIPGEWKGHAHTDKVMKEFEQLFQLKSFHFIEEISSPLLTPVILLFYIRPSCQALVRFLHDNTENVNGLGDVCSFALMDVKKRGDPTWNFEKEGPRPSQDIANEGKTELSVLHFATTNPEWEPPAGTREFMDRFRNRMEHEASQIHVGQPNLLLDSVHSLLTPLQRPISGNGRMMGDGLHRLDGPLDAPRGLFASISQSHHQAGSLQDSLRQSGIDVDSSASDMRVQALFIRELHAESIRQSMHRGYQSMALGGVSDSVFGVPQLSDISDSQGVSRYPGIGQSQMMTGASLMGTSQTPAGATSALGPNSHSTPFGALGSLNEEAREDEESGSGGEDNDDGAPPNLFHT